MSNILINKLYKHPETSRTSKNFIKVMKGVDGWDVLFATRNGIEIYSDVKSFIKELIIGDYHVDNPDYSFPPNKKPKIFIKNLTKIIVESYNI